MNAEASGDSAATSVPMRWCVRTRKNKKEDYGFSISSFKHVLGQYCDSVGNWVRQDKRGLSFLVLDVPKKYFFWSFHVIYEGEREAR